ncbi:MAG: signal peptidase II [Planctomycetota bacterium]
MNSLPEARSYRWLFWLIAAIGLTADLVSKYEIFAHMYDTMATQGAELFPNATRDEIFEHLYGGEGASITIIPGAFRLHVSPFQPKPDDATGFLRQLRSYKGSNHWPHVNKGALFGFGQGRNILFGAVSVLAAAVIIGWSFQPAAGRDWFLCVALGLILAGTLGNLYDRIVFEGVRDFLHWYKWIDWPVFNIADVCLVCGAGMLLLEAFFRKPEPAAEPAS